MKMPTIAMYFFAFKWLSDQKDTYPFIEESNNEENQEYPSIEVITSPSLQESPLTQLELPAEKDINSALIEKDDETKVNQSLSIKNIKAILPRVFSLLFNLALCFFY